MRCVHTSELEGLSRTNKWTNVPLPEWNKFYKILQEIREHSTVQWLPNRLVVIVICGSLFSSLPLFRCTSTTTIRQSNCDSPSLVKFYKTTASRINLQINGNAFLGTVSSNTPRKSPFSFSECPTYRIVDGTQKIFTNKRYERWWQTRTSHSPRFRSLKSENFWWIYLLYRVIVSISQLWSESFRLKVHEGSYLSFSLSVWPL